MLGWWHLQGSDGCAGVERSPAILSCIYSQKSFRKSLNFSLSKTEFLLGCYPHSHPLFHNFWCPLCFYLCGKDCTVCTVPCVKIMRAAMVKREGHHYEECLCVIYPLLLGRNFLSGFILVCIVPVVKELPRVSFWSLSLQIRNMAVRARETVLCQAILGSGDPWSSFPLAIYVVEVI